MLDMTERDLKIVASSAKRRIGRPLSEVERSELAICWLKRARKTESVATCNWQSVGDFIVDKMRERERDEKTKAAAVIHRDTLRADRCIVAAIGDRYLTRRRQQLDVSNPISCRADDDWLFPLNSFNGAGTGSYTHLTLPTTLLV